jgi:endoglycosylceramidase
MFSRSQAAALGAALMLNPALARLSVDPETRMLVDENGRSVLLHGVNVVYKVAPYIPSDGEFDVNDSLNDYDIANLKQWGMNFVRLGVMWEGVERQRGVYDKEYLARVDKLITKLGEAGIYTLVDAH